MATIIEGGSLMLFVGGKAIACATNHTLNITSETSDTSHKDIKGGLWKSSSIKSLSWEVSSENLFTRDGNGKEYDDLFSLMIAKEPVAIKVGLTAEATEVPTDGWAPAATGIYSGNAIITSLSLNAPNGDNASFSVTLTGVGALAYTA